MLVLALLACLPATNTMDHSHELASYHIDEDEDEMAAAPARVSWYLLSHDEALEYHKSGCRQWTRLGLSHTSISDGYDDHCNMPAYMPNQSSRRMNDIVPT